MSVATYRARPRARAACLSSAALLGFAVLQGRVPEANAEIHPRAESVVQRYLDATGGREARAAERTLRFKGRIQAVGLTGSWEMVLAAPDHWVRRMRLGSLHLREGFDGQIAWRTDLADHAVIILSAAEARHARDEGWFLNERWALADQGGGKIQPGSTSYGGEADFESVVITSPQGETRRAYVNAKTGFIERVTGEVDNHPVEDRPGSYKMLGGRKRPSVYEAPTLLPSDKPIERMTVDSVWVNVPVDFASKCVIVKASINGAPPAEFILDTGASLTAVDQAYATQIGLKAEGEAGVEGIAASAEMKFARVATLSLSGSGTGAATLRDFRVAVLDFGEGSEVSLWRKTHGLLGADFLSRFVVEIDYDSLIVTLHDPESFRYPGHGAAIPFELFEGIPVVELGVNGRCSGKFMVDVGNAFQFVVHRSLARPCGLVSSNHRREIEVIGGGVGGGFVGTMCRLDSLRIGPYAWPEPVAVISLHTGGGVGSKDLAGNIGNSVLERFRCTFDYSRRTLYLEPGRRYGERDRVSRFGAMLARVGTHVVAGNILSKSAAYDAGLRWYDEIVAIDGKPLEKWTRDEVDRLLEEGEVGSVHKVTYRRLDDPEQIVEVTLKDVL